MLLMKDLFLKSKSQTLRENESLLVNRNGQACSHLALAKVASQAHFRLPLPQPGTCPSQVPGMALHIPWPGAEPGLGATVNQDSPAVKGLSVPERERNSNTGTRVSELWCAACEAPAGRREAGTEAPWRRGPERPEGGAGCGG